MHGSIVLTETSLYSKDCTLEKQTGVLGTWIALIISAMNYRLVQNEIVYMEAHRPLVPPEAELARGAEKGVFFWRIAERPILQKTYAYGHEYA